MSLRTRWIILWVLMGMIGTPILLRSPDGQIRWVAVDTLNVSSGPTTDATVTRQVTQGETVKVLETTPEGWARISSGQPAEWVFAAHLSRKRVPAPPAPPTPLAPKQKPRVYVAAVVDQVCRILLDETTQVTQCYAETVPSDPSYRMVIHGRFSANGAHVMCQETAREVGALAERLKAKPVLKWRVQVHFPYTGDHPLAACWMYR